jgi:hypothetical protein
MSLSRIFLIILVLVLFYHPQKAQAVPSFARQSGLECSACHVGAFGPQLTELGREFKLGGYTMGGIGDRLKKFSGMVYGGFEHTKDTPPGGVNNHWTVDQASLFYAGALSEKVGVMAQATWSGPDDVYGWDNVDLRYADTATLGGKNLIYGITLNNNPSVQDLWHTTPAWQFPFLGSSIGPGPAVAPEMTSFAQTTAGLGAYGLYDGLLYVELSGYGSLGDGLQQRLGVEDPGSADHIDGIAPYWRVALQHDFPHGQYASIGTFGMDSKRYPGNDRTQGSDTIVDSALDATYQVTLGDHNISAYGSILHENQHLSASQVLGVSTNSGDSLNFYNATASYYYKNTYGITVNRFVINGSADPLLYADNVIDRPDSAGWTTQVDFTPFGTSKSFGYPNLNARFFLQYTAYDKLDGASAGASGNNTVFTGVWLAF